VPILEQPPLHAGAYYVIEFRPAQGNLVGAFRPVQVHVKKAGASVRARAG